MRGSVRRREKKRERIEAVRAQVDPRCKLTVSVFLLANIIIYFIFSLEHPFLFQPARQTRPLSFTLHPSLQTDRHSCVETGR